MTRSESNVPCNLSCDFIQRRDEDKDQKGI
jgi:hypothetical protein